jgi:AraC-like DNA-binding protein
VPVSTTGPEGTLDGIGSIPDIAPENPELGAKRTGCRHARVTEALRAEPGDRRALAAWARAAGASPRTLARLFVRDTGLTFGAWRQRARLLRALVDLAGGAPVTTTAFDLGYDSPSAFIAAFKRELGVTPGRYFDDDRSV